MATISRTKATLRIIGDDLLPADISASLGCMPSNGQQKGEEVKLPSGKIRVAKSGMWRIFATEKIPGDLDLQITEILDKLTDDLGVWNTLTKKYRVDLFCGIFMERNMEGISLSPESLLKLGERKILLDLDIYGPDDEDENV